MVPYFGEFVSVETNNRGIMLRLTQLGRTELTELQELYSEWQDWELIHELLVGMVANGRAEWFDPSEHGLTSSQLGIVIDGRYYWHERYAVESATDAIASVEGLYLQRV